MRNTEELKAHGYLISLLFLQDLESLCSSHLLFLFAHPKMIGTVS